MNKPQLKTVLMIAAALLATTATGATAAAMITGAQVKDGSLTGADIHGATHLQFKGIAAGAKSPAPVLLNGIDTGEFGQAALASRPARQIIAKSVMNVPFTGRIQATATARLDINLANFGNSGRSFGNCSLDIQKSALEAPRGGYQLQRRVPGVSGQYNLWAQYDFPANATRPTIIGDHDIELSFVAGANVTQPGSYTVYLTCANTRVDTESAEVGATGSLEARATAN